ncbi:MAG TPA: hypothetical protein VFE50_08410 [Cyclobacteriaceae bacterium]|nr:hypothetical protein [Cyclobacteriaceae bacterium]
MKLIRIISIAFFLAALTLAPSCGGPEAGPCGSGENNYKIEGFDLEAFYDAIPSSARVLSVDRSIDIPEYTYVLNARSYTMKGDVETSKQYQAITGPISPCEIITHVSHQPVTPKLQWRNVEDPLIVAAIFKKQIGSDNQNQGLNDKDAVWGWHSGLGTGKNVGGVFQVAFEDGREVSDRKIQDKIPAHALTPNTTYFWAVWSWDREGLKVIRSSIQMPFITVSDPFEVPQMDVTPFLISGGWTLSKVSGIAKDSVPFTRFVIKPGDCTDDDNVTLFDKFGAPVGKGSSFTSIPGHEVTKATTDCYSTTVAMMLGARSFYAVFVKQ